MNYAQVKAIEAKNKQLILAVNPGITEESGIYIFTRCEDGFKYAYVGQAKHLLTRLAQHLTGYQHIDLSLKKHGLYSEQNVTGWKVVCVLFPEEELNHAEIEYIKTYADRGYQLRNKTGGSQGEGKFGIADNKPSKGYYDGLNQGYENARKEVRHLFELHLDYKTKSEKPNKNQEKAVLKFKDFLEEGEKKCNETVL